MRLVVAFMSGLLAALLEPVKFTWRHLLTWLQGLITAALKLALHQKEARLAVEAAELRPVAVPTLRDIPGPTPLPFFGTRWIFNALFSDYKLDKIHEAYSDMFRRYGPTVKEEALWNYPIINVSLAHDIEKVIKLSSKFPIRPPNSVIAYYKSHNPDKFSNTGLVNEQGDTWHAIRAALTPDMCKTKVVQGLIPGAEAIANDYINCVLRQRDANSSRLATVINLNRFLGVECTCLMTLGERMGMLDVDAKLLGQKLCTASNEVFKASNEAFYGLGLWKYVPTKTYTRFAEALNSLYDLLGEFVEAAIEATADTCQFEPEQTIMVGILRRTDIDIRDKKAALIDFILSGIDPIGNSLSLLMSVIARNPEAQEKLHQEISSLLEPGEPITAKFLQNAKYLKACVQEYFRLLPSAPMIARVVDCDLTLSGYHVPSGSVVLTHMWEACKNEKNFIHPEKFLPERWIASEVESNPSLEVKSPFLVAPFGFQRRICPGKKFAYQTLEILLAKVVQRFELRCDSEVELKFNFLLTPAEDFTLQFRDRV